MKGKTALLQKVDLFMTLKPTELDIVARYSEYYTFHTGDTIFHEGEHDEELFIIKDGEVLISKHRSDQRDQDLARFISGEYFGEMDLLDDAPRSAVARAEKETTLLIFPKKGLSFQDILHHEFAKLPHILSGQASQHPPRKLTFSLEQSTRLRTLELLHWIGQRLQVEHIRKP